MGYFFYNIFVYPLEMLVEFVYIFFEHGFENAGIAIAAISIIINLLALPLYNIADSLQKKERDVRLRLQPGITRIKSAFKGDEQYMMLSTFYRQNNYHPAYALRSSISLIIQVPFFIAAYHFLSHLEQLQGQRFSFIPNLGAPDGLLTIGGISINLLPILMTFINVIAGVIYTKGFPLRDKVQLYGMAGLFFVLLYQSPAGLVFYWTLNNVFSLLKNIFYKFEKPLKVFYFVAVSGIFALAIAMWLEHPTLSLSNRIILFAVCGFMALLPLFVRLVAIVYDIFLSPFAENKKQRDLVFIFSVLLLFLLSGIVIPVNLISSSTIEFSFTGSVENPLAYVANTATIFFGLWVVWGSFIYALANKKMKAIFSFLFSCLSLSSLLNLFVFKGEYDIVSRLFQFENPSLIDANAFLLVIPIVAIIMLVVIILVLLKWGRARYLSTLLTILVFTAGTSGLVSCSTINREFRDHKKNLLAIEALSDSTGEVKPVFHLSREEKNVVFLFLDRAFSYYFPTIIEQFPEMQEQFKGFVFYPNTVSFGSNTIHGAPAMMGGYEYSPDAMDERSTEKLVDKHNEALLVLPRLFLDSGYSVTVTDPPYSNYKWAADYTPFKQYPEMRVMQHLEKFSIQYKNEFSDVLDWDKEYESGIIKKRLPLFSIFKITFPLVRKTLYDGGTYLQKSENPQDTDGFIDSYAQLYYLQDLTDFDAEGNTYTFISNDTPHQSIFLQAPDYEPQAVVTDRSTPLDGNPGMRPIDIMHYQVNAASLRQVGLWLKKLQDARVYDNTRIIIVADHGHNLYSSYFEGFSQDIYDYASFSPLMLFKDFDSDGAYMVDDSFMTNADAPLLAMQNLDIIPINPFTGNNIEECVDKTNVKVYSGPFDPRNNLGNVFSFDLLKSFSVHDSIFEESNWTRLTQQETELGSSRL
ncbi:MAG: YidC/Oxa1 family membrane protein insertase [Sphaerochaeta sp.]